MTTIIVPNHLPKINPPNSAIGEPKPKNGKTHNIVKIKKIEDIKNKLEFFYNFLLNFLNSNFSLYSLLKNCMSHTCWL